MVVSNFTHYTFTRDTQDELKWLKRHIPHRICAVLPGLSIRDWDTEKDRARSSSEFHNWCVDRSVEEGQKAGMRWLIEFVGVRSDNGAVGRKNPGTHGGNDVTIQCFALNGADLQFPLSSPEALKLLNFYLACTRATSHTTTATNHVPINKETLVEHLLIILKHLQDALYTPRKLDLRQEVHRQADPSLAIELGEV